MSAPTQHLATLHGGLRLPAHKRDATAVPILAIPVPAQLVVPLEQRVGQPARPVVEPGDRVLKRQPIAAPEGGMGVPVHAPSSGVVVAIEPRPVAGPADSAAPCIVIDCDGHDTALPVPAQGEIEALIEARAPADLLAHILDGGIVGLGGAVFPTAQKLVQARASNIETLVLNGVECEPYISCDDVLMRERAAQVIGGARLLMRALEVSDCVIAIESDKPEAIGRLQAALDEVAEERMVIRPVPTIYPSGAEDQLVQLLTGREVPSGGLPTDAGCLVQNVGTAAAVHDWLVDGEPLISRITTVTGDGIASPVNVRVRIGTRIEDVVAAAGGYRGEPRFLIVGGPMTGRSITTDQLPIDKASNCILALADAPSVGPEMPCIRCGECAAVCPVQLLPQQLLWFSRTGDEQTLRELGLPDCIECGCCDLVCPSHIPLTSGFRRSKGRIRELADEKARAERARRRFEARSERLAREQRERDAELARQKETAKAAGPDAIAAILARKRRGNEDDSR